MTQAKNYIYVSMLHGILLFSGEPDSTFINSLHTNRNVKWKIMHSSQYNLPVDQSHSPYNMVVILDPACATFGFLSGLVRKGNHLFLPEKQKMTVQERLKLIQLAEEGNSFIQIRNDILFHPSLLEEFTNRTETKLVEIRHISPGNRNLLQEMLYCNLQMTLRIIDSEVSRISVCIIPANGYHADVLNLHLNFFNGSAASLTISFTGEQKEHLLSVHTSAGLVTSNFRENNLYPSSFNPGFDCSGLFSNSLLLKQIDYFTECLSNRSCQQSGLAEEAKTYGLLEKINQKLEAGSVLT